MGRQSNTRRRVRRLLLGSAILALLAVAALWIAVVAVPFPIDRLEHRDTESHRLLDRHGLLLREAPSDRDGRGAWRGLDAISPWVVQAFIAIEDHRFYDHPGVDVRGITRAFVDDVRARRVVAGGSTLTQQLVRQVIPLPHTLGGKLREALWALRLERVADKRTILEQYVNRVPFGHGTFGIEAAARLYLGKRASELSLAEAALLAGIPRSPSLFNPFTDAEAAKRRQRRVLDRMRACGFIDDHERAEALAEPLPIRPADRDRRFAAPHFTTFALAAGAPAGDVPTTLDLPLQGEIEAAVRQTVRSLADLDVTQAAAVVLDNRTGDVLAWVGSVDFFDPREGQVDMVLNRRQPGSTLKPFLYELAFENGFTAGDEVPDLPLWFPTSFGDYRPRNYDRRFHGWVPLRTALASSYNVPAVWLAWRLGVPRLHERLRALGFDSLGRRPDYYGLGLALGNGEVRLLELANAYRTLANEGVWRPARWRRDEPVEPGRRILPAAQARLVTDILADPLARIPAFGRDNVLEMPFPAAVKTGTSTDFTDNWTVGFSSEVTVAVWVGNFDGRPMQGVSGITGAGRLWHLAMRAAMRDRNARPFSRAGLEPVALCRDGDPEGCRHRTLEWLVADDEAAPRRRTATRDADAVAVTFPDDGDVFGLSADVPAEHARLRLAARAPDAATPLVWEIDGVAQPPADGPYAWWTAAPGAHVVRVWPAERPADASHAVHFEVLP
jgi:penicillin-binding protein 1C